MSGRANGTRVAHLSRISNDVAENAMRMRDGYIGRHF